MRRMSTVLAFLFVTIQGSAQNPSQWEKVDTITAGNSDDLNPVIVHNAYGTSWPQDATWLLFERHTPTETFIAGKRFLLQTATWDSAVTVVASAPYTMEALKYPEYAEFSYYGSDAYHTIRIAAWQQRMGKRWGLFYSTLRDSGAAWSPPAILVNDTVSNTSVRINPIRDSLALVTWKRANTLMAAILTPSMLTPPQIFGVSTLDDFDYDTYSMYQMSGVLWSSKDSAGQMIVIRREVSSYPGVTFASPETLALPASATNVHAMIGPFSDLPLAYDAENPPGRDVYIDFPWWYPPDENISNDSLSVNRNANGFRIPIVTLRKGKAWPWYPQLDVFVYEKYHAVDSSLVFLNWNSGDTVKSAGHNWNACVGSQPFSVLQPQWGMNINVVWESNRSGRSHIYGRRVRIVLDDVDNSTDDPGGFQLFQNYPNPFNPSTVVQYQVPAVSEVRLAVYDLLGREVAVLVRGTQQPGIQTVTFDASGLSSGVYFYRLEATPLSGCGGTSMKTRRLLLLR